MNPLFYVCETIKEKMNQIKTHQQMKQGIFVDIVKHDDIYGTWIDERLYNNENMIYVAQIDEDTITLYVLTNNDDTITMTWSGTFDSNFDISKDSIITSVNYRNLTDDIDDASHRNDREFKYINRTLQFKGQSLGDYSDVTLKKWSKSCFRVFKLPGERQPYYNEMTNKSIDFGGFHFDYPYYFDIIDERSKEDRTVINPSDKRAYAQLGFRTRGCFDVLSVGELYASSKLTVNDIMVDDDDVIYDDGFIIDDSQAIMSVYYTDNGICYSTSIMNEKALETTHITVEYMTLGLVDKSPFDYIKDYKSMIQNAYRIEKTE